MSERERIITDLKRWMRQQREAGVDRVYVDRDYRIDDRVENAPLSAPGRDDSVELSMPAAAGADAGSMAMAGAGKASGKSPSKPRNKSEDLFESESPVDSGRRIEDVGEEVLAEIAARHPQWHDSELLSLAAQVEGCRSCSLSASRSISVPGMGNPRAKLAFVGEAPGAEEDRQGVPFVGRAGQLLDKILAAIDLKREDVHIMNILKCRPPENRNPAPDEIEACRPFLERQLEIIEPQIIVALGLFAAQWLTGKKLSLTKLRETGPYEYRGIRVYATYHPAALLRNPNWKKPAWEDFKIIRREYDKL